MKTMDIKYPKLANFEEKKEKELGCWKNAPAFCTSQLWPWKTQAIMQPSSPRCTHGNWIWRSLSLASGTDCGTSSGRHAIREPTCCTSADRRVCTSAVQVASDSFKRSTSCKLTPRKNAKSSRRERGLGKNFAISDSRSKSCTWPQHAKSNFQVRGAIASSKISCGVRLPTKRFTRVPRLWFTVGMLTSSANRCNSKSPRPDSLDRKVLRASKPAATASARSCSQLTSRGQRHRTEKTCWLSLLLPPNYVQRKKGINSYT